MSLRDRIPLPLRLRLYDVRHRRDPPARRYPGLVRAPAGESRIVLTFDDGPDPDATPAVLDALDAAGGHATFFLVGEQIERHPEIAASIVERGHEAGVHAYRHVRHATLDATDARDEVRRAHDAVASATGSAPRWFRPPFGRFNDASFAACHELGLTPAYWSGWGLDWEPIDERRIASLAGRGLDDGSVILLHDSARYATRESAAATARAVPLIAEQAATTGLTLASLTESVA